MMSLEEIKTIRLHKLPVSDLQPLIEESQEQGFKFLKWLEKDYAEGKNRFEGPGEALFAVYEGPQMIAIGGLNRDPFLPDKEVGRVRRVYVLSAWRRKGIGKQLMQQIISEARPHFQLLTLRTLDPRADKFYRAIGFQAEQLLSGATHSMILA